MGNCRTPSRERNCNLPLLFAATSRFECRGHPPCSTRRRRRKARPASTAPPGRGAGESLHIHRSQNIAVAGLSVQSGTSCNHGSSSSSARKRKSASPRCDPKAAMNSGQETSRAEILIVFQDHFLRRYATRHTVPDPSSVTIREPSRATATPTGRPQTFPSRVTKPTRKSSYSPVAFPSFSGMRITL